MLGSFLAPALQSENVDLWQPRFDGPFPWGQRKVMVAALESAARAFGDTLQGKAECRWIAAWTAGIGVVGSTRETLEEETYTWRALLEALAEHVLPLQPHGLVFFSSSTGGVYGGCGNSEITEATPPSPISAYGHAKLQQEHLLTTWAERHPSVSTVIGRISNLYGERQNLRKSQGLLAHLSQHMLRPVPLHIYVSLDTIRDYVYAGDCARAIAAVLARMQRTKAPQHLLKIFASERTTTIAEIIGIFARMAKLRPRIVYGKTTRTVEQPQCLRFHSLVMQDILPLLQHTRLTEGILRIHEHHRRLHAQGLLSSL